MNLLENKLVEKWRSMIFEAETQLKKYENTSENPSYEEKCVIEAWEQFLFNQKNSLENYINFLNHRM